MTNKLELLPKDILERLKELLKKVAHVEELLVLWLFGSMAQGEATSLSDVDLTYLSDQDLTREALESFENRLYCLISSIGELARSSSSICARSRLSCADGSWSKGSSFYGKKYSCLWRRI